MLCFLEVKKSAVIQFSGREEDRLGVGGGGGEGKELVTYA